MNTEKFLKHLRRPQNIFYKILSIKPEWVKNDELFLKARYSLSFGRGLRLDNPQTYSEKLQWLKLYNHRPEYTTMVDKYAVKEYVANIIGEEHVIPTYGVWEKPEDIEWDKLPSQFVLKTTHDSGGIVICRNNNQIDKHAAEKKLNDALKHDFYSVNREWPYKNVPRRIIAEQYIESNTETHDLPDYKFFCFDGVVKALFVATERQNPNEEVKFDFFDPDFNSLPIRQGHEHAKKLPQKPKSFEEMKMIASKLSKGIPHVRIDLYEVDGKVFLGEMTFFHFSGFTPFVPEEWDYRFGEWLVLPSTKII